MAGWFVGISVFLASVLAAAILMKRRSRKLRVPDLEHKSVFITGCDSGFGYALALRLDTLGLRVFAGCLTESGDSSIRKASSSKLVPVPLDVTKADSIQKAYATVKEYLGEESGLWGLCNNAGILTGVMPMEFKPFSDVRDVMEVNFFGMAHVTYTFLPLLKKGGGGRVVNISSLAGLAGMPNIAAYSASKYAVLGFSESLRREKKDWDIMVSTLCPGGFQTGLVAPERQREAITKVWSSLPDDIKQEYGQAYYEDVLQVADDRSQTAPDINPVIDAYEHALCSRYPRALYVVGKDAHLIRALEWVAPSVVDKLTFGIMAKPAAVIKGHS